MGAGDFVEMMVVLEENTALEIDVGIYGTMA